MIAGHLPCDFTLTDVTGVTGETLPVVWLYEEIVIKNTYANVKKTGCGDRGNIYTIV